MVRQRIGPTPGCTKRWEGIDLDTKSCAIVMEELAKRGSRGIATAFGVNNLGSYPLLIAGTLEQQKQHFGAIEGKYGAFALTEPGEGF